MCLCLHSLVSNVYNKFTKNRSSRLLVIGCAWIPQWVKKATNYIQNLNITTSYDTLYLIYILLLGLLMSVLSACIQLMLWLIGSFTSKPQQSKGVSKQKELSDASSQLEVSPTPGSLRMMSPLKEKVMSFVEWRCITYLKEWQYVKKIINSFFSSIKWYENYYFSKCSGLMHLKTA